MYRIIRYRSAGHSHGDWGIYVTDWLRNEREKSDLRDALHTARERILELEDEVEEARWWKILYYGLEQLRLKDNEYLLGRIKELETTLQQIGLNV